MDDFSFLQEEILRFGWEAVLEDIEAIARKANMPTEEVFLMCKKNTEEKRAASKSGKLHKTMGIGLRSIIRHPNINVSIIQDPKVVRLATPFVR